MFDPFRVADIFAVRSVDVVHVYSISRLRCECPVAILDFVETLTLALSQRERE